MRQLRDMLRETLLRTGLEATHDDQEVMRSQAPSRMPRGLVHRSGLEPRHRYVMFYYRYGRTSLAPFCTDPPGALRGPLRGASSSLVIIDTPSVTTLRGPSGGHCVGLLGRRED